MRFNRTRHKLLGKLAEKYVERDIYSVSQMDIMGLTLSEIDMVLGKRKKYRSAILSQLAMSKEIHAFKFKERGFFITPSEGLSAFSEKKYLRKDSDIYINFIKLLFEILVPILALMVALLTLLSNRNSEINDYSKEIERNAKSLHRIESQLKTIQQAHNNQQSNPNNQNRKRK